MWETKYSKIIWFIEPRMQREMSGKKKEMSHLPPKPLHCPTVSCCHFLPQSHIAFSAVSAVCRSCISLYIMRQFEKRSSCLGSPDYTSSMTNCFPPRWLGIINWGALGGRIQLPTIPAHSNAVQNLPFRPAWWQWLEHQGVTWSFCDFPDQGFRRFGQCPPTATRRRKLRWFHLYLSGSSSNKLFCLFIPIAMFLFVICHLLISQSVSFFSNIGLVKHMASLHLMFQK